MDLETALLRARSAQLDHRGGWPLRNARLEAALRDLMRAIDADNGRGLEFRAVACEPDTGDIYDSTPAQATAARALLAADAYGLTESNPDLPGLVIRVQQRTAAGEWHAPARWAGVSYIPGQCGLSKPTPRQAAWTRLNQILDAGGGDTSEYRDAWDEWVRATFDNEEDQEVAR